MATTYTATGYSYHGTTDGSAADDIKLDAPYVYVQVVNRDSTNSLTAVLATGETDAFPTLTVGGDGTVLIAAGDSYTFRDDTIQTTGGFVPPASRVKLLSTAAVAYSVYGRNA